MINATISVDLTEGLTYLNELTKTINNLNESLEKLTLLLGGKAGIEINFDEKEFEEQMKVRLSELVRQKNGAAKIVT